jgi:hypothetical protein
VTIRHRILIAAATGLALCGCVGWRSPWSFEDADVADPNVQALLHLADRPERAAQGFAPLPTAGRISLGRLKWYRSAPPGLEAVTPSAFIQTPSWSRDWHFGKSGSQVVFLYESETIHSRNDVVCPTVNGGRPFWEYVQNDFAASAVGPWKAGHHVWHVGAQCQQEMPLEEALALARTWFAPGSNWAPSASGGEQGVGPDGRGPG